MKYLLQMYSNRHYGDKNEKTNFDLDYTTSANIYTRRARNGERAREETLHDGMMPHPPHQWRQLRRPALSRDPLDRRKLLVKSIFCYCFLDLSKLH